MGKTILSAKKINGQVYVSVQDIISYLRATAGEQSFLVKLLNSSSINTIEELADLLEEKLGKLNEKS